MASVVTVNDIINLLDEMAPPELAESWDNVGLMLGRRNKPVRKLLFGVGYDAGNCGAGGGEKG